MSNVLKDRKAKQPPAESLEYDHNPDAYIAPGTYPAYCKKAKVYYDRRFYWDGQKYTAAQCLLYWDIIHPADLATVIAEQVPTWMRLPIVNDKYRIRRGCKYWKWWVQANNDEPPTRSDRMTHHIFERRMATVTVDYGRGGYSIVQRVESWDSGPERYTPLIIRDEPDTLL